MAMAKKLEMKCFFKLAKGKFCELINEKPQYGPSQAVNGLFIFYNLPTACFYFLFRSHC